MSSGQDSVMKLPRKLWEHPDPKSTDMYKFMQEVNKKHGLNLQVRGHELGMPKSHADVGR